MIMKSIKLKDKMVLIPDPNITGQENKLTLSEKIVLELYNQNKELIELLNQVKNETIQPEIGAKIYIVLSRYYTSEVNHEKNNI